MSENTILEAALSYAKRGWYVFPCRPKLKVPLTTHGVKDATVDEATIHAWWTRWPDANVALACGERSGVYVVDVDVDPDKNVDGWSSLEEFPDMPLTVRQDSPRGGAHFLFKTDDPPRNKNNFRNGIDIRSEGYYIMLTPSISVQSCFESMAPDGIPYAWCPDQGPDEAELAEFPDHFRPEAEKKVVLPWERPTSAPEPTKQAEKAPVSPVSVSVTERASLYLRECAPAVEGQGGHDSLLWAARALVSGFKLSRAEAIALLWTEFNPRCSPPWNPTEIGDIKDFERKVDQAIDTPSTKPDGWLLDEFGLREFDTDDAAIRLAEKSAADMIANAEKPKETPISERWTEDMFNQSGFVGEFYRTVIRGRYGWQRKFALVSALVTFGCILGRKVKDIRGQRTNLFGFLIGESSDGKGASMDFAKNLLHQCGIGHYLVGDPTSDSAIEKELQSSPVKLLMIDECGEFLGGMKNKAGHSVTIPGCLKKLWSSAKTLYPCKCKVEGERNNIDQNCLCFVGAGTPEKVFGDGFNYADVESGLLPRCLVVFGDDRRTWDKPRSVNDDIPESLLQIAQAWIQRVIQPAEGIGNITEATTASQIVVRESMEVSKMVDAYEQRCYHQIEQMKAAKDPMRVMWGKAAENASRIALILACSDRYDNPEISVANRVMAEKIMDACIYDALDMINGNMHENAVAKHKSDMEKIICCDSKPKTWAQIAKNHAFKGIHGKILHSYASDLEELNIIEVISDPACKSKTKKKRLYFKYPYGTEYMLTFIKGSK